MEIWLPILSAIAAALGSFIGVYLKLKSEKSKHLFDTKIDVYQNLIRSYREVVINKNNEEYRQKYVSAQEQVELIASEKVNLISKEFYDAKPDDSPEIQKRLVDAMREDLQSTRKL